MRLLKNILNISPKKDDNIIDGKSNVILTKDTAYLMDCILTIYASGIKLETLHVLHLELYRCSIYISHPDLKKVIAYLVKKGLLSNYSFSEN